MSLYTVHIYREMRLRFDEIKAKTPEAAAAIARERLLHEADHVDDCDGETFAALVDEECDHDYEHSKTIDFEPNGNAKPPRNCWWLWQPFCLTPRASTHRFSSVGSGMENRSPNWKPNAAEVPSIRPQSPSPRRKPSASPRKRLESISAPPNPTKRWRISHGRH